MTIIKRSVAVVVRWPEAGTFLVVRRPDDPADPLAGLWGFPAVTLTGGEDERAAVVRAGRDKLGVELAPGARLGEASADRGTYLLVLADYAPFVEDVGAAFPRSELGRLRDLGDRVLLGTDFPNLPYPYADALEALEATGLGAAWLRAVCRDNAARLFGLPAYRYAT